MIPYGPDTHALIWYFSADKQLGRGAKRVLDAVDAGEAYACVSTMVLAEVMYLAEKGRTTVNYDELLAYMLDSANFTVVDVILDVLMAAKQVETAPEIFDCLIAATAMHLEAKLITRDELLSSLKGIETVW